MVQPVAVNSTNVYPTNKIGAMDKMSTEQIRSAGLYARELGNFEPEKPKKKHGFFRFLTKLVVTAAVVGGALYGGNKLIAKKGKFICAEKLSGEANLLDKGQHLVVKSGTWVEEKVIKKVPDLYKAAKEKVVKVFEKKADDATPPNQA